MERPRAHSTDASDTEAASGSLERVSEPGLALYEVQDRRASGEWRTIDTFRDPAMAREVCALLVSMGADARVELIPAESIIA
jgi:hypothetical protein